MSTLASSTFSSLRSSLIYFFYPETCGLSPESIEMFIGGKDSIYWRSSWVEAGDVGRASLAEDRKSGSRARRT